MWIFFALTKKLVRIPKADILKLTGIGFLAALHWVTFYVSIKYAKISVALVFLPAVVFFTALVEPILLKTKVNWIEVLLGLMVITGIYLIFHFDPQYKLGILLGLICALLMAFVMILIRQLVQRINPETVLTYQISGGFVTLTILMPVYFYFVPTQKFLPNLEDTGWLLILAWLCSVWAFQLSAFVFEMFSVF